MRFYLRVAALFILLAGSAYADREHDIHPVQPTKSDYHFYGYIDGSYNYLTQNNKFTSGIYDRVYDLEKNGFSLQQLSLTLSKRPEAGWGGLVNVIAGRDANEIALDGLNPNVFGIQNIGLTIGQAFLRYRYNPVVVKLGDLLPLPGVENYYYTQNKNFSHSILDGYAQPGSHLGIRYIQRLTHTLTLIAGLGNGWNTIKTPLHQDNVELALSYKKSEHLELMINTYSGRQGLTDDGPGPTCMRYLFDMYGTYYFNKNLNMVLSYDYGYQARAALPNDVIGSATWHGLAAYLNYQWNDQWSASVRGEVFNDADGYRTGVRQNWREATLTLAYSPIKNLEVRAETRHDFSNVKSFLATNGIGTNHNQQSYALEGLYSFS